MSAQSDASLLRDWTIGGSEEAFAIVARRYAGLLYHAALRRTGREDLAGEAAQNSLLILARKAPGLTDLPSISGWLHRTACYEAAKLLRRERRHEARMKTLPPPDGPEGRESPWQEAAPLLDQALDALPEKDREVIFLKYFDGMSFEQMARQFGGEPAAWRQRGSRAVERLRVSLVKRGVAVSSGALAMGLGTTLSEAAPASVVATLSASPAAGAAALSWPSLALHSLHLMKIKSSVVITAALLLSLLPLGLQSVALASTKSRVVMLESEAIAKAASGPSPAMAASSSPGSGHRLDLAMLVRAYSGDTISLAAVERKLPAMTAEELESLLRQAAEEPLHAMNKLDVLKALFTRYCELAETGDISFDRFSSTATLAAKACHPTRRGGLWDTKSKGIIDRWLREDPDAAIAWYRESLASGVLGRPSPSGWSGSVFRTLHEKDPASAIGFYRTLPDQDRQSVIEGEGVRDNPALAIELSAEIKDPTTRWYALKNSFMRAENASPEEIRDWIDRFQIPDAQAMRLLVDTARGLKRDLHKEDIADRLAWLQESAAGLDLSKATASYFVLVCNSTPHFREALDDEWQRNPDEAMLAAFLVGSSNAGEGVKAHALKMSRHLKDPQLRDESLKEMLTVPGQHPEDRRKFALKIGMSQEEVDRLFPNTP